MTIDLNDEIMQDFLVEAGEILDILNEQLVQLENAPKDHELLNAIFRGFHTIKGGAGFLELKALVEICHKAEDVFNILRQGERLVTPDLMDLFLQVLDRVNAMFTAIRNGEEPESAEASFISRLGAFVSSDACFSVPDPIPQHKASVVDEALALKLSDSSKVVADDIRDMLSEPESIGANDNADDGLITEEEFDALLDELHGKGQFKTSVSDRVIPASGDITEDEFESYLDQLHGKGKFNAKNIGAGHASHDVKSDVADESAEEPEKVVSKLKIDQKGDASEKAKPIASQPAADSTVRVDTHILDEIMNMVGELVLVRNRFQNLKAQHGMDEHFGQTIANLDLVTANLQLAVMKTRMQPIKKVFGRFPRVVRDLARGLRKEIRLEMVGEETDLDKNLVEALADPLVHLVRNAVDHGIETPYEREASGKPREGLVILKASQEGDHIHLSISDDGKGMNPSVLRHKVIEKGLMDEEVALRLTDKECFNLIFMPGFSTKSEISDISGRGVGMDVVKTKIAQMNGVVEVDSKEGAGSVITIKVPLTLAIMQTLMVKLDGQAFALPLANVIEILDIDLKGVRKVDSQQVVMVRDQALPIFFLGEWLVSRYGYEIDKRSAHSHVVVVNNGGRKIGFVVDQLVGQEEVVIKALGAKLHGIDGLSGATITGDGKIALILDIGGLLKRYV